MCVLSEECQRGSAPPGADDVMLGSFLSGGSVKLTLTGSLLALSSTLPREIVAGTPPTIRWHFLLLAGAISDSLTIKLTIRDINNKIPALSFVHRYIHVSLITNTPSPPAPPTSPPV